jgi:hypothetical protein
MEGCCDEDFFMLFSRVQQVRCGNYCDVYFPYWTRLGRGKNTFIHTGIGSVAWPVWEVPALADRR